MRRAGVALVSSLIRMLISLGPRPTVTIVFSPNYLLEALCPNIVTLGVRASTYEFGERHGSVRSNCCLSASHCSKYLLGVLSTQKVLSLSSHYIDVEIEM